MVKIKSTDKKSRAERAGIKAGDTLLHINGHEINDVLDYGFYLAEKNIKVTVLRDGKELTFKIKKDVYDDIGLNFETALMDDKHRCENGCIFCFIDQNPKGMRPTVYFKDDDSRLSFIHGNYVTLTNMKESDIDRIIDMHISPINVSVHTTDPELRVKMMKNKRAGESLRFLQKLADGGCELHCQIVLCRGVNDGEALTKTMTDLAHLYPAVTSVSVVPAGLTAHREGLYPLSPFTPEECAEVISSVGKLGDSCLSAFGTRIFYASDEFYLTAGLPLPEDDFYGDYQQLDNGVGLITSFLADVDRELSLIDDYEFDNTSRRRISIATGEAAYGCISDAVTRIKKACPHIDCTVYAVKNEFFGGAVTVTGLLTGTDMRNQLKDLPLGDELLISSSTLRAEGDLFLCGHTPEWLSEELGVIVTVTANDAASFISGVLGCKNPNESEVC